MPDWLPGFTEDLNHKPRKTHQNKASQWWKRLDIAVLHFILVQGVSTGCKYSDMEGLTRHDWSGLQSNEQQKINADKRISLLLPVSALCTHWKRFLWNRPSGVCACMCVRLVWQRAEGSMVHLHQRWLGLSNILVWRRDFGSYDTIRVSPERRPSCLCVRMIEESKI